MRGGVELIEPNYDDPDRSEPIRRAFRGERVEPFETTAVRKGGEQRILNVTLSLLTGESEADTEIAILARDVTEQRRIEEEAAASQMQLREMAQNMREALWLRDIGQSQLLYVSPGYDEIFGASRDELETDPRAWIEHVIDEDKPAAWAFAQENTGVDPIELRIERAGEIRWILVRPFIVEDADGVPYRRGGVVEDITPSKRETQRLAELAELRQRLVTQALEAEERVRSRVSVALHDEVLQLILTAGQDLDDAVERGTLDGVAQARTTLHAAVRELRAAVRDLHPLVLDHLGAAATIRQIGNDLARRAGFKFTARIADGIDPSLARLTVALARELLSNAARHAQADEVSCEISTPGNGVRMRIADDGRGTTAKQLDAAVAAGHIGLASARERVEAAGGRITINSDPRRGTAITIELPPPRDVS
jgi:PAS domain S-box-containing protein